MALKYLRLNENYVAVWDDDVTRTPAIFSDRDFTGWCHIHEQLTGEKVEKGTPEESHIYEIDLYNRHKARSIPERVEHAIGIISDQFGPEQAKHRRAELALLSEDELFQIFATPEEKEQALRNLPALPTVE